MDTDRFNFIKDPHFKLCLEDAYRAVDELDLWNYLRENVINSFTYYEGPYQALHSKLLIKADLHKMHSGASYGITMRNIEQIAKNGFNQWKKDYILNYYNNKE